MSRIFHRPHQPIQRAKFAAIASSLNRLVITGDFNSTSSMAVVLKARLPVSANFNSTSHLVGTLQNNDPNIISASFNSTSSLKVKVISNLVGTYRFRSRSSMVGSLKSRVSYGKTLRFLVDVIPETSNDNYYQSYTCRFLKNDIEIPIHKFSVKYPRNSVGCSIELGLARISDDENSDLDVFTGSDSYKFDIGIIKNGVTTWHNIIDTGILESKSYTINAEYKDTINISTLSEIDRVMSYSPESPLIIYDVNRVDVDSLDVKPIPDTLGNFFVTEKLPFNPLTVHDIMNVITSRARFAEFRTNIPNFQFPRLDIGLASSYMQALNTVLVPFKPVLVLIDGILWILDTTTIFPEGFPSPGRITADNYPVITKSTNHIPVDGLIVTYMENELDGEAYSETIETISDESGSFGSDGYQRTDTETTTRNYYRLAQPNVITNSLIVRQKTSVYVGAAELISENTENFSYDSHSRLISSEKEYRSLLPDIDNDGTESMLTIRSESESITYGPHPYEPNRQIQLKRVVRASGLRAIDSENQYFGADMNHDYLRAHESGELNENMTSLFAPLWTITETTRPVNNGQVKVYIQKIDHARKAVTNTISASRTGDITLSSLKATQKEVIVYRKNYESVKDKRFDTFNLGPVPTSIGIPLVERIIAKRNSKNGRINFDYIGFNPYVKRGTIQECVTREGNSLGNFFLDDIAIEGDNMGDRLKQIIMSRFSGDQV